MAVDLKNQRKVKIIMARYTGPKCKLCRREGAKLFLKGDRCFSPKCPIEKKGAVPPGIHGKKRTRRLSAYGLQLREKQKAKRLYGILERKMRTYYREATKTKKSTGLVLLQLLETRLDNVLFRSGLCGSRSQAKQLISHGHVQVNNKKVSIPSYRVKASQTITLSAQALEIDNIKKSLKEKTKPPAWLERKAVVVKMARLPERKEMEGDIDEQLIVEFYSR